jgi:hypothetical protein
LDKKQTSEPESPTAGIQEKHFIVMKSFISLDPTGQRQEGISDLTGSLADQANIAHDKFERFYF